MTRTGKIKILIVDDTEPIAKLMSDQLEKKYGDNIHIFTAYSGDEAFELMKQTDIDILISDLEMPGMDGISLLRKSQEDFPDTLRILLSGYADLENLANALNDCGIRNFINKPWKASSLYIIIDSAINEITLLRENARLQEINNKSFLELFSLLNDLISELSPTLFNYSLKTASLCAKIAEEMGYDEENSKDLETAAMLHAISLLGMPTKIYRTHPSQLSGELRAMYAKYPEVSAEMLKSTPRLAAARALIKLHTENVDGSGPLGMKGNNLPVKARILRLCVHYYAAVFLREADKKNTLIEISRKAGTWFDKKCLEVFLKILSKELGAVSYPVRINDLKLGMKLGKDIYSKTKSILLPQGAVINNLNLKRLRIYNELNPIGEVYVIAEN